MTKVERFEDLVAWQKARALRAEVYRMASAEGLRREFDFTSQIKRASVYIDRPTFDRLSAQAEEVARIAGGLRTAVVRQRDQARQRA